MGGAEAVRALLLVVGLASAGGAGWCGWRMLSARGRHASLVRSARKGSAGMSAEGADEGRSFDDRVIAYAVGLSHRLSLKGVAWRLPSLLQAGKAFEREVAWAGLQGRVSAQGFAEARVRLALGGAAVGAVMGAMFSTELMALLAMVGALLGWRALPQAIRHRRERRTMDLERHLPEMIDVMAMGMRSGLSFDRSLALYVRYFPTMLAQSFGAAQRQWSHGLARRDDALRALAKTYDSPVFGRVIESMIRSLRFGSSLAASLEALGAEARSSYRAQRQEQVAKAPIKIMVPTGTLILPAMLILVLGPVLLELMGDF